MDIPALVNDQVIQWTRQAPADPVALKQLALNAPFKLPDAYLEFLSLCNGGEGQLGVRPGWFQIWPAETVQERNEANEVQEYLPDFYGFGSNGAGEMLAFRRVGTQVVIYYVTFIGMEEDDALKLAGSFEEFLSLMGHQWQVD